MGDQGNPARPETRVLLGAGNLLAERVREFAENRRDVDPGLLENAAAHDRHDAAAAIPLAAGFIGALPAFPRETARRRVLSAAGRGVFVLQPLEGQADAVA